MSSQLVLDALRRAAADPAGSPLFCQKANPGLFGTGVTARQAAQKCKELKLLEVVRSEPRGKSIQEVVVLTPKGMEHLLSQSDPRLLLEDMIRALETREKQWGALIDAVRETQASLTAFKAMVATVLGKMPKAGISPAASAAADCQDRGELALRFLADWSGGNPSKDCPLPRLFQAMRNAEPDLTSGAFHDALRTLHHREQIYLHPWTGPLCELPDPGIALLVGHEVAYYASLRP